MAGIIKKFGWAAALVTVAAAALVVKLSYYIATLLSGETQTAYPGAEGSRLLYPPPELISYAVYGVIFLL